MNLPRFGGGFLWMVVVSFWSGHHFEVIRCFFFDFLILQVNLGISIFHFLTKASKVIESEIFEGIQQKDNQTFLYLYKQNQGRILNLVQNNNGNEEDARDIFQEGLIALWTNIEKGKFQLTGKAKISTYLFTLCRNLWISKLRKDKQMFSLDENPTMQIAEEVNDMEETYDQIKKLENSLNQLGETCRKLLRLFYYKKSSLREIAQQLGITENTAKNNKYRCMQSLKQQFAA